LLYVPFGSKKINMHMTENNTNHASKLYSYYSASYKY
jgi:hypothetical protein